MKYALLSLFAALIMGICPPREALARGTKWLTRPAEFSIILDQAGVHVIMRTPEGLSHEIPEDRMRILYRRPLRWLNSIK